MIADRAAAATGEFPTPVAVPAPGWVELVAHSGTASRPGPVRLRRVVPLLIGSAVAVLVAVAIVGTLVSRTIAEDQAVHDAAQRTDLLADTAITPALTNGSAASTTAALAALDDVVRTRVLGGDVVRVKVWTPSGRVVYSDERRLVGRTFALDDGARTAFSAPQVRAEVSDLSRPENRYEARYGKLLEVYRPVWTPAGTPLLFEAYFRYDAVADRAGQLWRGFAGITASCVLAIAVLLVPLVLALVRHTRRAQQLREDMAVRALDASAAERRRIAATLHDGVLQHLAAAGFSVGAGAAASAARGETALADQLAEAGAHVRGGIVAMRSLLVDIYPASLESTGLAAALSDLAADLGADADLDPAADRGLDGEQRQAMYRVAQEAVRNADAHADATRVTLRLHTERGAAVLTVADDGRGFDATTARKAGHLGLDLMLDAARSVDALLRLRTAPGHGTTWEMTVA